jgi:hypothetical protein
MKQIRTGLDKKIARAEAVEAARAEAVEAAREIDRDINDSGAVGVFAWLATWLTSVVVGVFVMVAGTDHFGWELGPGHVVKIILGLGVVALLLVASVQRSGHEALKK